MKKKTLFVAILLTALLASVSLAANVSVKLDSINGSSGMNVQNSSGTNVATIDSKGNLSIVLGANYKVNNATLDATMLPYADATYNTVGLALDHLLYVSPGISNFTNSPNGAGDSATTILENGTTVTSTVLKWVLNKAMTNEVLDNGIGSLGAGAAGSHSYTHTNTYTTDRTYNLTAYDSQGSASASTSIYFRWKWYVGVNGSATINDAGINALGYQQLATSRALTVNNIAASSQYIYVCYPASWGTATFTVNGLPNTDWTSTTQTHVNTSGGSVSYLVYHTNSQLTGSYNITVN
ncbi:MAG TPA: hypothetical protein VMD02_05660 [Candidatus Omnitrophota bacterium]|nr:hypothetical protein [Candidatus Omnitrophota bacterium]